MTALIWFLAAFGILTGLAFSGLIVFDVYQWRAKRTTISQWLIALVYKYPVVGVIIAAIVFFILGNLSGHLFFAQQVP